jgi:putative transposase
MCAFPYHRTSSRIVQHLKGGSSRKLQMEFPNLGKQFWGQHLWQIGYVCCTTGTVTEPTLKQYIEEQGKKEEDEDKTFLLLG